MQLHVNQIQTDFITEAFTEKVAQHDKEVVYDVMIPLGIWFGFCEDYRKPIVNSRHKLILNRFLIIV